MRLLLLLLLVSFSFQGMAQCKTFRISSKGDTLNCTDQDGSKRGKWIIHVDPIRGNPGYDEEGEFFEDRKDGIWRRYNAMGDLVAIQNYKWGNLNGISQYYTVAGLEREESWLAMNPNKAYDTLDVEDVNNENQYIKVVVKNDGKSMKHGTWKWYRPGGMSIVRSEVYSLNKLQEPGGDAGTVAKKPEPKKEKPKEVEQYEKKNSKKKTTKEREGKTG
jgi:hypothetical protein